jgi:hypothetical protein
MDWCVASHVQQRVCEEGRGACIGEVFVGGMGAPARWREVLQANKPGKGCKEAFLSTTMLASRVEVFACKGPYLMYSRSLDVIEPRAMMDRILVWLCLQGLKMYVFSVAGWP